MASEGLHEPIDALQPATIERHRANVSLREELEAIDWYDQRVDATRDAALRRVLEHNRDEEKEHAAMVLEWLRRNDPVFHKHLSTYLFSDRALGIDAEDTAGSNEAGRDANIWADLGIGSRIGEGPL
ncbi:MAG TPA: encapsulin-associated ferritin-like protein [Acidimicrobiales bacterium]|nr:encapsulin-associated ferritin-like protein [Acidimicrobiales bacterium]